MKWSLSRFVLIASLLPFVFSKSSSKTSYSSNYNRAGYNYISPHERQTILSKAKSIQSTLFPYHDKGSFNSSLSSSFLNSVNRLPISNQCKQFFNNYPAARAVDSIWTHELEDAQGKVGHGIMKGNTEFVGDFDECVNMKVGTESNPWSDHDNVNESPVFTGRYCTLVMSLKNPQEPRNKLKGFKAEKIGRLGFCSLTACSKDDLNQLIRTQFEDDSVSLTLTGCDGPEEWQLASTPFIIRFTFAALVTLLIVGTVLDRVTNNSTSAVGANEESEVAKPLWMEMLISFSLPRNMSSILWENETPERSRFINVLKAICMLLVLHGHGPLTIRFVSLNSITQFYYMLTGPVQAVINAGFLSVDFFLFTSAFISVKVVFPRFKDLWEQRAPTSSYLIHSIFVLGYRYMRIAPALIFLMMTHVWSEYLIAGPVWQEYRAKYLTPCRDQWLPNLLMISNILPWNPEEPNCAFHSWYLGLDMQLFIFSLLFFIILGAIKPKLALGINFVCLLLSILAKGFATYYFNYPPTVLFGNRDREYMYFSQIYTKPWFRADPYILGLFFGYYTRSGHSLRMSKMTKMALHTLVIGSMISILKIPHNYHDVDIYSGNLSIALFGALHRAVWSLCLGWIFHACYNNDFPILTTIAKWHIWEVLSNASYQFFLFHPLAFFLTFGAERTHFTKGQLPLYLVLIGICMILLLATLVLPAIVEWPFSNIMKAVKNKFMGKKLKKLE